MPRPAIDLTGQRFGRLTVVKRAERPKGRNYRGACWLCKCDCGNEVVVWGVNLRHERTRSCGCIRAERVYDRDNLTGRRFGNLTVIEKVDCPAGLKSHGTYWHCRCDCGKETVVHGNNLRNGNSKSCGCRRGSHKCGHVRPVYVDDGREFSSIAKTCKALGAGYVTVKSHIESGKPMRNGLRVSFEPFV